jgi:hypothetical protein
VRLRLAVLAATAACATAACDKPAPTPAPAPAESAATEPKAATTAATPAAPTPSDLDVPSIEHALGCPRGHKDACRILAEFASAGTWQAQMPSGEGAWVGTAVTVQAKMDISEPIVLGARRVPTSEVGPGDLPLKVGFGPMPSDMRTATDKLVAALGRGDTVPKSNAALAFAKSFTPPDARIATKTTGSSVRLISNESVYVRQTSSQKVLVVRMPALPPGKVAVPGEASYAELWPVSW